MAATVTCVWTNDTARDLFERYERHRTEIKAMMAIPADMLGPTEIGTQAELEIRADALITQINRQMADLVRNFAMPAAIVPKP